MTVDERRDTILGLLEERGKIPVSELADRFGVTMQTIRRDLDELVGTGGIMKLHGKVVRVRPEHIKVPAFLQRVNQDGEAKGAIARAAAALVEDNDTIAVDCTTTVHALVRALRDRSNLTVVTNSVPGAEVLIGKMNSGELSGRLISIGGDLDIAEMAAFGQHAFAQLEPYFFDKVFIGAGGVSLTQGITAYGLDAGVLSATLAERADAVILLVDKSKILNRTLYRFGDLKDVNTVITTCDPPDKEWNQVIGEYGITWINALANPAEQPGDRSDLVSSRNGSY